MQARRFFHTNIVHNSLIALATIGCAFTAFHLVDTMMEGVARTHRAEEQRAAVAHATYAGARTPQEVEGARTIAPGVQEVWTLVHVETYAKSSVVTINHAYFADQTACARSATAHHQDNGTTCLPTLAKVP